MGAGRHRHRTCGVARATMPSAIESEKKSGALAPKGLLTTLTLSPCAASAQRLPPSALQLP